MVNEKKQTEIKKMQSTKYIIFVLMFIDYSSEWKTDQLRLDIAPSPLVFTKNRDFLGVWSSELLRLFSCQKIDSLQQSRDSMSPVHGPDSLRCLLQIHSCRRDI